MRIKDDTALAGVYGKLLTKNGRAAMAFSESVSGMIGGPDLRMRAICYS
jgi:hypothetical protein